MTTPAINIERLHQILDSQSEVTRTLGEMELVAELRAYWEAGGASTSLGEALAAMYPFVYERWEEDARKKCTRTRNPLDSIG